MYGDFPFPQHWPETGRNRKSMTAIVRILTSHGFVLAADGRGRDERQNIIRDDFQKIFPVLGRPLGYAVHGYTGVGNEGTKDILIDIHNELENGVRSLARRNPADLIAYADKMVRPVYRALLKAKNDRVLEKYPGKAELDQPGFGILHVWLVGYHNGSPSEVDVRLFHRDQRLYKPVPIQQKIWIGYNPKTLGSLRVAQLLYESNDVRFARFRRTVPSRQVDLTLSEAIEVAKAYINACDSDEGRAVDPEVCEGIGGKIQIATITPSGFQWVPGFEYSEETKKDSGQK